MKQINVTKNNVTVTFTESEHDRLYRPDSQTKRNDIAQFLAMTEDEIYKKHADNVVKKVIDATI